MKKINLLLLFILFTLPVFAQTSKELVKQAGEALEKKNLKEALSLADKAIELDGKNGYAYSLRGDIYLAMRKFSEAFRDYDRSVELDPENPHMYVYRAIAYYTVQRPDEAIMDYNDGIKYATSDSVKFVIISNRGNAKAMMRDFRGAYEDYSAALAFDSTSIAALTNIAAVCDEVGKGDETIGYLLRVIRLAPDFVGGYGNLGFKYSQMGRYQEAILMFDMVLKLSPDDALGFNNRGYAKMMLDDHKGAMKDINKSLELYPDNSYAHRNRALLYIKMKKEGKACEDIDMAIRKGFTDMYGNEMLQLKAKHCGGK